MSGLKRPNVVLVYTDQPRCIEQHRDGPFFIVAGIYAPHAPVNPPQRFIDLYDAATLPGPKTILDYCGVQVPPVMQGRSFRPLLEGRDYRRRSSAFIEYLDPFRASWKTVRTGAWKYCTNDRGAELLFDLEADPDELRNLAGDPEAGGPLNDLRRELLRRWFDVENQYPRRTGAY